MKAEIDMNSGSSPAVPWACAPEGREPTERGAAAALPDRSNVKRKDAQRHAAIHVTRRFGASSVRVFDAWLDPQVAGLWLFATAWRPMAHVDIDARVGGSFGFVDRHVGEIAEYTGEYSEIVPHRRLAFTLSMAQHPHVITRVAVDIAPRKNGCVLKLTHENVPRDHASHLEGRWTGILYGLAVTLDPPSTAFHHDQE